MKSKGKINCLSKINDLFEEIEGSSIRGKVKKNIKSEYVEQLKSLGFVYDAFEDKFYDRNNLIEERTFNLLPENFLRVEKKSGVELKQFTEENRSIVKSLNKDLNSFNKKLGTLDIQGLEGKKPKMKIKKIRDLFHIWQGHQITDEEIYNSEKGDVPILTGHNAIKGYTDKPFITDIPCITIPSKGVVNKLYLQTRAFDANNTVALIPKDRKEIDLEYVIFTKSDYIKSFISSRSRNNYLNRALLEDIEIEFPEDIAIQSKIADQYRRLFETKEFFEVQVGKISKQVIKNIESKKKKSQKAITLLDFE